MGSSGKGRLATIINKNSLTTINTNRFSPQLSRSSSLCQWKNWCSKVVSDTCQIKFIACMQHTELLLEPEGKVTIKRECCASKTPKELFSLTVLSFQKLSVSWWAFDLILTPLILMQWPSWHWENFVSIFPRMGLSGGLLNRLGVLPIWALAFLQNPHIVVSNSVSQVKPHHFRNSGFLQFKFYRIPSS